MPTTETLKSIIAWIDERLDASPLLSAFLFRKIPEGVGWFQTLGFSILIVFVTLAVTGIFLAMNYSPSPEHAYDSIQYITHEITLGGVVRGVHHWAASAMVVLVFLHMLRVFFMAAYKYPRELTWVVGVLLLLMVLGSSFTGYLLPWDQKAYWATVVGTRIASQTPVIGDFIMRLLRGGEEMGAATLTRFYSLHMLVIPSLIALLIGVHLFMVIRQGIAAPPRKTKTSTPGGWNRPPSSGRSQKDEYHEEYDEAKHRGEAFFPFATFKDTVMALLVVGVIMALAILVGAKTEAEANPATTTYNPRPEWYFLFLFEMLKLFPGYLEPVAAIGIPGLVVAVLLLLPFIDRRRERHPLERRVATTLGIVIVAGIAFLTYKGFTAPLVNPPTEASPTIGQGRKIFEGTNCLYCHSIEGRGGAIGPDLSTIGSLVTKEQLETYLKDPHAMIPKTLHPKLQFTDQELQALTEYLLTLGAPVTFSEQAIPLFQRECTVCHTTDGTGGKVGPDLSKVGTYRNTAWLEAFISNPKSLLPGSIMPVFQDKLTDAQIKDLAAYLYSLKGKAPSAAPAATATATPITALASPTPSTPTAEGKVSYSRDVQPILNQSCIACHGAAAMGGLNMTSYQSLMTTGAHGPVVIPGNSKQSLLHRVLIGGADAIPRMPPGSSLPQKDVDTIALWIDQGAAER